MTNIAQQTIFAAIAANLGALDQRLSEAAKLAREASVAMKEGKLNLAIGTALPLEQMLADAQALQHAALTLGRSAQK